MPHQPEQAVLLLDADAVPEQFLGAVGEPGQVQREAPDAAVAHLEGRVVAVVQLDQPVQLGDARLPAVQLDAHPAHPTACG
ncbi:hypothetical protein Asp14428_78750 [Actinoplanes sp. NBRC 14428]|nr:hypothetical protein Asp14428_78750 [Actinoplanes sp. NBRC 14428]